MINCAIDVSPRQIPNFPAYWVNAAGEVWSVKKGGTLKPVIDSHGYRYITLCSPKGYRRVKIARLVCETYRGSQPSKQHKVLHINGQKTVDILSNLYWGTHAENEADKERHGTRPRGNRHANSVLSEAQVLQIKERLRCGEHYRYIAEDYLVHPTTIFSIKQKKNWWWL
jgi:hypothetical protein